MRLQMHEKQKNLTLSAMFAAVIMLMIVYFFHIPVGANGGYLHFGDAFVYLAGCFLPMPYACAAAAIGGGLADVMSGAAIWAIPTMIIKPLTAIWFTSKKDHLLNPHNIAGIFAAGLVSIAGYYLAEAILVGNWAAPLATIWGNVVQAIGSGGIFIVMSVALDRLALKKRLQNI